MGGEYTLTGTVSTPVGGAADVTVEAVDADIDADDVLATTRSGEDGSYELTFTQSDAGGHLEGDPEVYLRVSAAGRTATTEPHRMSPGTHEINIELGPGSGDDGTESATGGGSAGEMGNADMPHHGMVKHRGMQNVPRSPTHPGQGRFGRMFPYVGAATHNVEFLKELGLPGGFLQEEPADPAGMSDTVPAGFVFLGQFIDHDITLDPLSSLSRQADPDALRNFRTPRLDLDSVYGAGPEAQPYLYQSEGSNREHSGDSEKFLLGLNGDDEPRDLPRNADGTALIGDPRNDENLILSQLQQAMLRFHNSVVDHLREDPDDEVFEEAQQLVRWHYQWIVLHEYLPTVCEESAVDAALDDRELFTVGVEDEAYMPLEFAGAVYRFGHSQARFKYRINDEFGSGRLFGPPGADDVLSTGFEPVPAEKVVDWRNLFEFHGETEPQMAREIDPKVAQDLLDLPFVSNDRPAFEQSLASRNLVRGRRLELPSGPAVARVLGEEPLTNAETGFKKAISETSAKPGDREPPLWYYALAEAREETGGETLGPVGSRIVAEVIVGLIDADPRSFRTLQPNWKPTLPTPVADHPEEYGMADLLAFALDYEH